MRKRPRKTNSAKSRRSRRRGGSACHSSRQARTAGPQISGPLQGSALQAWARPLSSGPPPGPGKEERCRSAWTVGHALGLRDGETGSAGGLRPGLGSGGVLGPQEPRGGPCRHWTALTHAFAFSVAPSPHSDHCGDSSLSIRTCSHEDIPDTLPRAPQLHVWSPLVGGSPH